MHNKHFFNFDGCYWRESSLCERPPPIFMGIHSSFCILGDQPKVYCIHFTHFQRGYLLKAFPPQKDFDFRYIIASMVRHLGHLSSHLSLTSCALMPPAPCRPRSMNYNAKTQCGWPRSHRRAHNDDQSPGPRMYNNGFRWCNR